MYFTTSKFISRYHNTNCAFEIHFTNCIALCNFMFFEKQVRNSEIQLPFSRKRVKKV